MFLARLALSILALAALCGSAPAFAAIVAIVRPAGSPPLMTETLGRIRGELTSVGFATEIVDEPVADGVKSGQASRSWLEQLATRRGFDAVVAIVGGASAGAVEVWVVDKVTKKSVVRTVPLDPTAERVPKTLSIRAIELLRSSFLEIDLTADERRDGREPAPPQAVVQFLERERLADRPERFGVELGGLALMSLDGVGPALLPLVRFAWAPHPALAAQATLAGLGTHPTLENQEGSAQVSQAFGLLGACYSFPAARWLRPFFVLSAGVLHTSVDGRTDSPANEERQMARWSFLLEGGLGARLRLRDRLFLSLGFQAQVAEPRLAVRLADKVVGTSAGPNLSVGLTVGAWL
jgi:hypothetical protein